MLLVSLLPRLSNRGSLPGLVVFLATVLMVSCESADTGPTTPTAPTTPVATTLTLSRSEVALSGLGETFQLSATVRDQAGTVTSGETVSWVSLDDDVASVSSSGLVTAVGPGSTTITAELGSLSASASVEVYGVLTEPSEGEAQIPVEVELPPGTTVATDSLRLSAGVREATLSDSGEGTANVLSEATQLLSLNSIAGEPVLLALTSGESGVSIDVRSTAEAIVFLTPLLVTAELDRAADIRSAILADPDFADLVEAITLAMQIHGADWLAQSAEQIGLILEEIVERVVNEVGSPRITLLSEAQFAPTLEGPGVQSGVEVRVSDDGGGVEIRNLRARWVVPVLSTSEDGVNFSTSLTVNGPPFGPANTLGSAGLFDLATGGGPSTTIDLPPEGMAFEIKVFGPGLGSASEALADPDSEYFWYPVAGTTVFEFAIPLVEVVLGVPGLQQLPIWGTSGTVGARFIGATLGCATSNSVALELYSVALTQGDILELLWPFLRCALEAGVTNVDIMVPILEQVGLSTLKIVAVNAAIPIKAVFLAKKGAEVLATGASVFNSDAVSYFPIVEATANAEIYGSVNDLQTLAPLTNATLRLSPLDDGAIRTVEVGLGGVYRIENVLPGTYELQASADGYSSSSADAVKILQLEAGDRVRVDFALPLLTFAAPIGGISGRVTNQSGEPLEGVFVGVSGGTQTNGIFRSTVTANDGTYTLSGIVLEDPNGLPIASFSVFAAADGYASQSESDVEISDGKTITNVDFVLAPQPSAAVVFEDGFEEGLSWSASSFWNRTQGGMANQAYPTYVSLAPDDASGDLVPTAPTGDWFAWFGTEQGNYMGSQNSLDAPLSGGRSTGSRSGNLVSPPILVPSDGSYVLDFNTWFEIESVNPNENGYDIMTISVETVSTGEVFELARLNPTVDPELSERAAIPFTSGGFNRRPVVRPVSLDLSAYAGLTVQLVYRFDTVDSRYNGFRGWLVDDVMIREGVAGPALGPGVFDTSRAGDLIGERCGSQICYMPTSSTPRGS